MAKVRSLSGSQQEIAIRCPKPLSGDACEASDERSRGGSTLHLCVRDNSLLGTGDLRLKVQAGSALMQPFQPHTFCLNCHLAGISLAPSLSFLHQKIFHCHKKEPKLGSAFFS